ncbi:MAG: hypothetical protein RLZZ269_1682 [Actinomycetota bacterium]|jgi:DNA-binding MarR family transcriptional regulator
MPGPKRSTSSTSSYRLENQIGFLLRKAHQRHRSIFSKSIGVRIATTQFAALASLFTDGPTSQNQLGRRTAMDSATITGVIDRLLQRGLVVTSASPDDDRLSIIDLTVEGRTLIEGLLPRGEEISADTLAPLTPQERETLVRLLEKISEI